MKLRVNILASKLKSGLTRDALLTNASVRNL